MVTIGGNGPEGGQKIETVNVPNLYVEEINHFSSCILDNARLHVPGEVGLANQKVLDAALKGGTASRGLR
jgi:predicted dehydrogenase